MNRPIARLATAVVGGLAVAAAIAALMIAALAGNPGVPVRAGWFMPLVAGGGVGALSWFLLSDPNRAGEQGGRPAMVQCDACGMDLLEDWRLCPYCGSLNSAALDQTGAARIPS